MVEKQTYRAGEVITRENEYGANAYVVERGKVEVTKQVNDRKIHLAYLGQGETFGEMSMIDDKPRSATVTAVEETELRVIHKDQFFQAIQTNPDVALTLLATLFERLREANAIIAHLQTETPDESAALELNTLEESPPEKQLAMEVLLRGVTAEAVNSLPINPLPITRFPFRIGRECDDPLVENDLEIPDTEPFQISRHHVSIVHHDGSIGVVDRGSTLGATVDGCMIGGSFTDVGPVFFGASGGTLVLGMEPSLFRFEVVISGGKERPANLQDPLDALERSSVLGKVFQRTG